MFRAWDKSWLAGLLAGEHEAKRLGQPAYGSEHALLGLLQQPHPTTDMLTAAHPGLTVQHIRAAVEGAVDDLPALRAMGLSAARLQELPLPDPDAPAAVRTRGHTAEFQQALNTTTAKYRQLVKQGKLPKPGPVTANDLWLTVLEPGTRSARLLTTIGIDPEALRATVLRQLTTPTFPVPPWPAHITPGLLTRLSHRFWQRVNVERMAH